MAGATLEIVMVDAGGSAVGGSAPPRAGTPSIANPPPVAATTSKHSSAAGDHELASVSDSIGRFARVLGYGGLVSVVELVTQSMRELAVATRVPTNQPGGAPSSPAPPPAPAAPPGLPSQHHSPVPSGGPPEAPPVQTPPIVAPPVQFPRLPSGFGAPAPPPIPPMGSLPVPGAGAAAGAGGAQAVGQTATAAASGLARVAAMALPVAAAITAVTGLGVAARMVSQYLNEQARELAKYSGVLAASTARADIRTQQSEMNRAQQLGPLLAKFQNDSSRMSNAMYNLGTQVLKVLLKIYDAASPIIDVVIKIVELVSKGVEVGVDGFQLVVDTLTLNAAAIAKDNEKLAKDMQDVADILSGKQADPLRDDPFTQAFLNQFTHPRHAAAPNGPRVPNMLPALGL